MNVSCQSIIQIQMISLESNARALNSLRKIVPGFTMKHKTGKVKLSSLMKCLISLKSTAVPVSLLAATTFTNARKLDIFNYFTYQNYNLHLKQMDHYFALTDLYNLFGCGISSINEFRRVFKRIMADLKASC